MKTLLLYLLLLLYTPVHASGITGSSGFELLYVYLLLFGTFMLFAGLDYLVKFCIRKYKDFRFRKQYPELDDVI